MSKYPPPFRPPTLTRTTRTYAHIRAVDLACPSCGAVHVITPTKRPANLPHLRHRARQSGPRADYGPIYDEPRGMFRCRRCQRAYFLGVIFWPAGRKRARPEDHVPSLEEGAELRMLLSHAGEAKAEGRATVNLVCTCGQDCPVHPGPGSDTGDDNG